MLQKSAPDSLCDLYFPTSVTRWDEALPLGNGPMGALIWGSSRELRFSLDRGDLWDTTPCPDIDRPEFSYQTMVRLAKAGDCEEIRRIFDAPYNHVLPTKLPAGKLILDFGQEDNIVSRLRLSSAEAELQIGRTQLRSFLHAEKKLGMIRISDRRAALTLLPPGFDHSGAVSDAPTDSVSTASLKQLSYPEPELHESGTCRWFVQRITGDFSYGIFAAWQDREDGQELAFTVASSRDSDDWQEEAQSMLLDALSQGYDRMFSSHCRWWAQYWGESGLELPDKLFEKNWYLTNYLLACCSRKGSYPMPLQGVWTADDGTLPPWKGDYHHDLNTQLCYCSYLKANHLPEGECFLDYLWSMADTGRAFAKRFYQAEGLCLPSVMTIDGAPLGGWGMYSLSPTNQLWLCLSFDRYWQYTGSQEFLEARAYPYLKETAACILSLLEEREGKLFLPISSSPEIHDDTIASFLPPNSNYDLALMRWLFSALEKMAGQIPGEDPLEWSRILKKLAPLSVNAQNCLMLSPDESLMESHRHFSHAMSIHPLMLLDYENAGDREIIDATIQNLEQMGTGAWVGYTFAWMAELYAVAHNGEGAAWQLRTFWECFCSQNGFHLNGDYRRKGVSAFHYRPFTLEGNFCAADALQEMLLQTDHDQIRLFPAIPDSWEQASFRDFRAKNGLLVSAVREGGRLTEAELLAPRSMQVSLAVPGKNLTVTPSLPREEGDGLTLFLTPGVRYRLTWGSC